METFYKFFLLFFLLTSESGFAQKPLSLKESIQIALQKSPLMDTSKRKLHIQELSVESKKSGLYPRLDLKTEHGVHKNVANQDPDSPWVSSASLQLSENFYDGGKTLSELKVNRIQLELEKITLANDRDKLILSVCQSYFDLSQQIALFEESKKTYQRVLDQFHFVNQGFQAGIKQKKDVQRLQARLQKAEIDLKRTENEIQKTQNKLKVLLVNDINASISFEPIALGTNIFPSDGFAISAENFYSIQSAKLTRDIQNARLDFAKTRYSPEISITSSASYSFRNYLGHGSDYDHKGRFELFAGIGVNIPLWDWGINRNQIRTATEERAISENAIIQEQNTFSEIVTNEKNALEIAKKEHKINLNVLKIEEETFASLDRGYKKGEISYLDLILGLDDLSSARQNVVTSFYQILNRKSQLTYFQGKLYDWASH